jgi:hypothetical protein
MPSHKLPLERRRYTLQTWPNEALVEAYGPPRRVLTTPNTLRNIFDNVAV